MKNFSYIIPLAVFALVLTAQTSYAACDGNDRVSYSDSWCLSADISDNNGNIFRTSRWDLQNLCNADGHGNKSIKIKVDIVAGNDYTYTLSGNQSANDSTRSDMRGVYCCRSDSGEVDGSNLCTFATEEDYNRAVEDEDSQ